MSYMKGSERKSARHLCWSIWDIWIILASSQLGWYAALFSQNAPFKCVAVGRTRANRRHPLFRLQKPIADTFYPKVGTLRGSHDVTPEIALCINAYEDGERLVKGAYDVNSR
jgi:hypothetical protein